MLKTIKKIILSSLSILGLSVFFWIVFLLNPNLSYANQTQFDFVTVYHNNDLEEGTQKVIRDAIEIIKTAEIFSDDITIQLCLNDDKIYPHLHPLVGQPTAFAVLNKTVIKSCTPKFNENVAETQWAVNNHELRKFNLTWLLAHEFTHNLQYNADARYYITSTLGTINWKFEGHAEYISREFKHDGKLKEKIEKFLIEEGKEHSGLPVFELADGTQQIYSYYKYALVIQYLMEVKELDYSQVCEMETGLDKVYGEMLEWSRK